MAQIRPEEKQMRIANLLEDTPSNLKYSSTRIRDRQSLGVPNKGSIIELGCKNEAEISQSTENL